mgnify:CR=1 FL=1
MKKTLLLILASLLLISFSAFARGGGAGKDEITIAMIVNALYNVVDTIFIGRGVGLQGATIGRPRASRPSVYLIASRR